MNDFNAFYNIGKLVGLSNSEINRTKSFGSNKFLIVFVLIIIAAIVTIFGTLWYLGIIDPYAENTLYNTIEPRFIRRMKKKLIRIASI